MAIRMALIGNPHCGKTTLFNTLTGSAQRIGNFPGVTVEKTEGSVKNGPPQLPGAEDLRLVDLPGIYSLSPCSQEERITRACLLEERPDVILNLVDITNLERNLYLTTQLLDLCIPTVIALNLADVAETQGIRADVAALSARLRTPVVAVSAKTGEGAGELLAEAVRAAGRPPGRDAPLLWCPPELHRAIARTAERYELFGLSFGEYPPLWASLRLLENDESLTAALHVPRPFLNTVALLRESLEKECDRSLDEITVDARYSFIRDLLRETVRKGSAAHRGDFSEAIDRIALNRFLGIPVFLLVMLGIFELTFSSRLGGRLGGLVNGLICDRLASAASRALSSAGAGEVLTSLVSKGVLSGVGSVLSFLPWILILFFCLAFLEDCGYLSRAAFLLDRAFRRFGLSGNSFIPMLLGFGCSVPALMSTRTIRDEKQRRITLMITPFMSCSARLPIYALFTAAFFQRRQGIVIFSLYVLGIVVAAASGAVLNRVIQGGYSAPLVMELPPYRLPTLKNLLLHTWNRAKQFLIRAGTILFLTSLAVWALQAFSVGGGLHMVDSAQDSLLADIGRFLSPLFAPLGFGDWKASVALLTGFIAKESVVSTMGVLHGVSGGGNPAAIAQSIQTAFTPLSAYAFMAFALLYVPCMAAFAALKREMNSWKWTLATLGLELGIAWAVSFAVYQGGRLLGFS